MNNAVRSFAENNFFFEADRKKKQRTQCSVIKNVKECKERSVLFIKNAKEHENVSFS